MSTKTAKTVAFQIPKKPADADSWVGQRAAPAVPAEPMRRFTIDVPAGLHTKIKIGCARRGTKMADAIRELLEREFSDEA